jgi:homopolymeric O-antigen transport system ATP-binding protein
MERTGANSNGPAVIVDDVTKEFVLPHERMVTLKGALLRALRGRSGADQFVAVRNVSFEVQPGEILGMVGRNGSGKTTLLSLIARIYQPTRGRIVTRGRVCALLGLGAGMDPELTGRDNVFLNAALYGLSQKDVAARYDAIAEFSELGDFLLAPVRTYSSGMFQRLAFSVAVHLSPDVLLLDEVLAVGDAHFSAKSLQRLRDICASGTTIILVSHALTQLANISARTIWLDCGEIVRDGETASVIREYAAACA